MLKLIEGHYRALESALPDEVSRALGRGTAAIVSAGSALQRRVLQVLAEAGDGILLGLEVLPGFPQLARRLAPEPFSCEDPGEADRTLLAMDAMASIPAGLPYSALSGVAHAARSLASFFEKDLLDRGIDPASYDVSAFVSEPGGDTVTGAERGTVEAVGIAFRKYGLMRAELFPGTHDRAVLSALSSRTARYGSIILYGFLDLNPLQRRLLKHLVDSCPAVVFMCPVPAAVEAWREIGRPTRRLLDGRAGDRFRADSRRPPSRFLGFADELLSGRIGSIPEGFNLVNAPGPAGVARAVIDALSRPSPAGTPSTGTAVIGRGRAFETVETILRSEGIPTARPWKCRLRSLPAGSLLSDLARLRSLDFHHGMLTRVSGSAAVLDEFRASPDEIATAVQASGARSGREMLRWMAALDGPVHARASALAKALLEGDGLIPGAAPPGAVLEGLCRAGTILTGPEGQAGAVLAALPGLAGLAYRGNVGFERFAEILEIVLECAILEAPGTPGAIELLEMEEARGTSFGHVIVFGLEEDVLPGVVRNDPRLPEALRKGLELPPSSLRETEQALMFRQVLECAGERLTLIRMTTDQTGREVSWSPFIEPLVETSDRTAGMLAGRVVTLPADPAVIHFGGSQAGHRDTREAFEGALPLHRPFFAEAYGAEASRLDRAAPFGPNDGIIGAMPGLAGGAFSPSRLQDWAACPFRYMAARLWHLSEPCDAGLLPKPPPLARGNVLHRALSLCLAEPGRPAPGAVGQACAELGLAGLMGNPVLAGRFAESAAVEVEGILAFLAEEGLEPDGADSIETGRHACAGREGVELAGRIDMILRRGEERIVLDLKTGSSTPGPRAIRRGIDAGEYLQVPLYAAILEALGTPVDRAGLLFSSGPSLAATFARDELEPMMEATLSQADSAVRSIRAGMFPPAGAATGTHCRGCWAAGLCRKGPDERIGPKLSATRGPDGELPCWDYGTEEGREDA